MAWPRWSPRRTRKARSTSSPCRAPGPATARSSTRSRPSTRTSRSTARTRTARAATRSTRIKSTKGQASAPDVVDIGNSYALSGAQAGDFAPYKVATWSDIPDAQKDSGGLWYSDYGGYISIGCNAAKVGGTCPTTIKDLDNPAYKGLVALNGDPTSANAAFEAVWAAALANGGSATNIQPGIDFFKKLNSEGIFNKTKVTPATVASGETPIVLDWDYLNVGNAATLKTQNITWTTADPSRRTGVGLLRPGDQHQRSPPGRGPAVGGVPLQPGE